MSESEERAAKLFTENSSLARGTDRYGGQYLIVRGQHTKGEYAVPLNYGRSVVLLKPRTSFCVNARGGLPIADQALTLALHIQHNERYFLSHAVGSSISGRFAWHCLRAGVMQLPAFLWAGYLVIGLMLGISLGQLVLALFR